MIVSAEFVKSATKWEDCPKANLPEYAFIGRSNVGKSSLINALTNRKKLAKTSSTPGKTQLINTFLIDNNWYLTDLPGYGYAKVSKKDRSQFSKMIEHYILNRENLVNLFVLADSRIPPQKKDLEFMQFLGKKRIPFSIVFTKIDKLTSSSLSKNLLAYQRKFLTEWEHMPPTFKTSSVNKIGTQEIYNYILKLNESLGGEFR